MSVLLCVKANPKPVEESKSLTIAREFLEAYRRKNPDDRIIEFNVYQHPVPFIDYDIIGGWAKLFENKELSLPEKEKLEKIDAYTEQFLAADKYVLVTPMWNLSLPPMMIAYIGTIVVAGKTFRYTEQGPVGMVKGKKALHIHARGGYYNSPPMSEMDFADRYLRALFTFLGIGDFRSIICEGHEYAPHLSEAITRAAIEKALETAGEF